MSTYRPRPLSHAAVSMMLTCASVSALADETASFAIDTDVKLSSDQRTRGVSDSLNGPAMKVSIQAVHESGLLAQIEFSSVSKREFLGGDGLDVTMAGGYRFGNPEAWHFGTGLAAEMFPGAKFDAPHGFDMDTFSTTNVKSTNYNTNFAVLEVGYGEIEGRILDVLSKTYRGADTGSVCGTMLQLMADPTQALECYARGDHGSRGTLLFDLDYKYSLTPTTTLSLHGGYQKVANFKEADLADYRIGITHKRWGFEWAADWVATHTRVRELYMVQDGDKMRQTDDSKLVLSVARHF